MSRNKAGTDKTSDDSKPVESTVREAPNTHQNPNNEAASGNNTLTNQTPGTTQDDNVKKTMEFETLHRLIEATESRFKSLEVQIKNAESENSKLRESESNAWGYVDRYIKYVLLIASVVFTCNVGLNVWTTLGVSERTKDLRTEITESKKHRDELDNAFDAHQIEIKKKLTAITKAQANSKSQLLAQIKLGNDQFSELKKSQEAEVYRLQEVTLSSEQRFLEIQEKSARTAAAVYEAISLLNIGQQRLAEQNPSAAAAYANDTLKLIERELANVGKDQVISELAQSLQLVRRPAWILLSESLLQMDNMGSLETASEKLVSCECPEGSHYRGIVLLNRASDEREDRAARIKLMEQARLALANAISLHGGLNVGANPVSTGDFDLVLLSAAYFDNGNYGRAKEALDEFLQGVPKNPEAMNFIRPRAKAQIALARAWVELCDFVEGRKAEITFPDDCISNAGVLLPFEGRIFERLFSRHKSTDHK